MATVDVTVSGNQLSAINPKEVNRGAQVTWNFIDPEGQGRRLLVEFHTFLPESGSVPIQNRSPFNPPFPPATGPISGIVDSAAPSGLYLYVVRDGDQVLTWSTRLSGPGTFQGNFGGIIIKDPPQTGGVTG